MPDERLKDPTRVGRSQVELDALLVAVEGLEEERVLALLKRRDVPADVAACGGVLDLDHLRAEVGELQCRHGPAPYCSNARTRTPARGGAAVTSSARARPRP